MGEGKHMKRKGRKNNPKQAGRSHELGSSCVGLLKAEGMRVIHGFLGVRSREVIGYQTVMERPYWSLSESSSEAPLGRILLFLRTEGP